MIVALLVTLAVVWAITSVALWLTLGDDSNVTPTGAALYSAMMSTFVVVMWFILAFLGSISD